MRAFPPPIGCWQKPADDGGDDGALALEKLGLPLFVKPSCGGSSTGSASVVDAADLAAAVYAAASEGHPALVERMIVGEEYTASVLEDKVLPLIKITVAGGYYDYHAKYIAEDTLFECPCGLPEEKEKHLAALALCCFKRWVVAIGVGWILFWIWTVRRSFWKSTPYRA